MKLHDFVKLMVGPFSTMIIASFVMLVSALVIDDPVVLRCLALIGSAALLVQFVKQGMGMR